MNQLQVGALGRARAGVIAAISHIGNLNLAKLMKLKEVLRYVPVSRATLYVMIRDRRFPKQIHLGGSGAFWVAEQVDEWIQDQIDQQRPKAA